MTLFSVRNSSCRTA